MPESAPGFHRAASELGLQFVVKNTFIEFDEFNEYPAKTNAAMRSRSQPSKSPGSGSIASSVDNTDQSSDGRSDSSRSASSSFLRSLPLGKLEPVEFNSCEFSDSTDPPETSVGDGEKTSQGTADLQSTKDTESALALAAELHEQGTCQPCLYANSKSGCLNGAACRFCHFPHSKKKRPRPCKAKRQQCKQIVNYIQANFAEDSPEFQDASARLSMGSSYMRSLFGIALQAGENQALEDAEPDDDLTTRWLRQIGEHFSVSAFEATQLRLTCAGEGGLLQRSDQSSPNSKLSL